MKPEHRRYILAHRDTKSATVLARDLNLKERTVRRFLEQERREKKATPSGEAAPVAVDKKKILLSVLLIVCVGALVYANALKGGFLWDDSHLVEENRFIRSWTHIPEIFTTDIGAGGENNYHFYRPLQILTYLFDYVFAQTNPVGYHLANIAWHILAALALFWLVLVLFKDHLLACVTALLFVAHPVHTEAVTYISGRADPLSTFFVLLTFVFYIKTSEARRVSFFLLAVLSYACALFSRENVLIVPLLLLLTHYAFRKKISWPLFLSLTGLAVLYIIARFTLLKDLLNYKAHSSTVFERLPGFMAALFSYVRLLILPLRLHMEYGGWAGSWGHPQVLLGLFVFLGLLFLIFRERTRRSLVLFAPAWFLIALLPVSNLYPINAYMAEHWLYLPSIGFFLLVAKVFSSGLRRERTKVPALIGLVVLTGFWGVLTVRQNATWLRPIAFFQRLLRYAPDSSRVYNSLGMAYNAIGEYETGVTYLERAVELSANAAEGDAVKAYNNLALAYNKLGRNDEAVQIAQGALTIDATHSKAYNNLAISLVRLGKYEEAIEACRKAVELKPSYAKAYNTMAAAYMDLKQYEEAVVHYRKAIELAPDYPEAQNNLGLVLQRMGRSEEAIPWHQKAIALRPDYANAYNNLAQAYATLGRFQEAKDAYTKAVEFDPKRADVYLNLAWMCLRLGEHGEAVTYRDEAKALGVSHPDIDEALASDSGK